MIMGLSIGYPTCMKKLYFLLASLIGYLLKKILQFGYPRIFKKKLFYKKCLFVILITKSRIQLPSYKLKKKDLRKLVALFSSFTW